MAFENNPNATATMTVDEPVVSEPEHIAYYQSFEGLNLTNPDGWNVAGSESPPVSAPYAGGGHTGEYYMIVPYPGAPATRRVSGLVIGRGYVLSAWVKPNNAGANVSVGVTDVGSSATVAAPKDVWTRVTFTFVASKGSHELRLVRDADDYGTGWDDITLISPKTTTLTPTLRLSQGDLTLDSSRYPYAEASVEVPLTTDDLLEQIKPGERISISATSGGTWNRIFTPWVEQRRNLASNPVPVGTTGWSSPGTPSVAPDGYTTTLTSTTTPYIFSSASVVGATAGHVYAFRAKVKATAAAGSVFTTFTVRAHKNIGNVYYAPIGGYPVINADGEEQEVAFYWIAPADIPASDAVNVALVGAGTGTAGSTMTMRDVLIEDVGTVVPEVDPAEYFAPAVPGDLTQTRFVGAANASASVLETREIVRVDWVPTPGINADLVLRERKVSHDGKKITLSLASDEAILSSWADIVDDSAPRTHEANLRALINYVLNKAIPGASLQAGAANADVTARWSMSNEFTNPAPSSATGYTAGSGTSSILYGSGFGKSVIRWTTSGTGQSYLNIASGFTVRPGNIYTVAGDFASSVSRNVGFMVRWLNAEGATIRDERLPTVVTNSSTMVRSSRQVVAPPTAAKANIFASSAVNTAGQYHWVSSLMWYEGVQTVPHFSGASTNGGGYVYSWEGTAGESASTRTPSDGVERLPELFTWEAGQTAWDFLAPLVASAGLRLFCDEQRRWYLIDPSDWTVPGRFSARPDNTVEGTDTMDADDEDNGVTGVVAIFKWEDPSGISRTKKETAGSAGKVKVLEFDRQYPGPGIAAAHLAKVQGLGRTQDVTVATDYSIRPGQEVQIDLPGTYPQLGTVNRIRWELTSGLMSIGSAGLRETPPGAIDLLSGTIDSLTGTIDSL